MKKLFALAFALSVIIVFSAKASAGQTGYNSVLEYCTGTWCGWCACAEVIADTIKQQFPRTVILAYHGPFGYDPWALAGDPMISLLGFNGYPEGIVNRVTGIMDRTGWQFSVANYDTVFSPGADIAVNNYVYNSATHTITANIVSTARSNLTGTYYIMMILTEDNVIYPQSGTSSCPAGAGFVHNYIVRSLINGAAGTFLSTTNNNWTAGFSVTTPLNYAIPSGVVDANCILNIFIYRGGLTYSTDCQVQQSTIVPVTTGPTGIISQNNNVPAQFSLSQNYPNPFNPATNIHFTLPKDGDVSLKIYDMLGNLVDTYSDGFMKAGTYNAEIDASSWASGIYFYTLRTADFFETKKMVLVK